MNIREGPRCRPPTHKMINGTKPIRRMTKLFDHTGRTPFSLNRIKNPAAMIMEVKILRMICQRERVQNTLMQARGNRQLFERSVWH